MNKVTPLRQRKTRQYPILVVENGADQWLLIRSALIQCFPNVEPIWKNHPAQTLIYLKAASVESHTLPWLIFMSPLLPSQEEGWDFLSQLKSDPKLRIIPVLVLGHSMLPKDVITAYSLGASTYITKHKLYKQLVSCFAILQR